MTSAASFHLRHIVETARSAAGLNVDSWSESRLNDAIHRALRRSGSSNPAALAARLPTDPGALDALLTEFTVGETYFLREPAQLRLVAKEIVPDLSGGPPSARTVRLWSAACATGEEAYSLAMVLREAGTDRRTTILGTELSAARLEAARRARYRSWSLRALDPEQISTHFVRVGEEYEVRPEIRAPVQFRQLNLMDAAAVAALGAWDVILCRNALMYLDRDAISRVAASLLSALSPDGYLILGSADPMLSDLVPCAVEQTPAGLVYRRPRSDRVAVSAAPPPAPPPADRRPAPRTAAPARPTPERPDALYRRRDYPAAADSARECVAGAPGDERCWVVLVRSLANQGRLPEAVEACAAARQHASRSPELAYLHALLLSETGQLAQAVVVARQAVYLHPDLAVAHLLLGGIWLRLGEIEGSRRSLRSAIRLLSELPPDQEVPASDGETAMRLLASARTQLRLLSTPG